MNDEARCSPDTRLAIEVAAKAREWAECYPRGSDPRNTFILFADWVETLRDTLPPSLAQTRGQRLFVECATCGGSGFSGRGTGYDDVCSECGGCKFLPLADFSAGAVELDADDLERHEGDLEDRAR
jgi:hypothetical protein